MKSIESFNGEFKNESGISITNSVIRDDSNNIDNLNPDISGISTRIVRGCMDTNAVNRDPNATVHDASSCIYPTPEPSYETSNGVVNIILKSNTVGTSFTVNDNNIGVSPINFKTTEKELQTTKIIRASKNGYSSDEYYEVFSKKKTFKKQVRTLRGDDNLDFSDTSTNVRERQSSLAGIDNISENIFLGQVGEGTIPQSPISGITSTGVNNTTRELIFTYFEITINKVFGDGTKTPIFVPNITDASNYSNRQKQNIQFELPFELTQDEVINDTEYIVRIIADVPSDDIIFYRTSSNTTGFIKNGNSQISLPINEVTHFIEFQGSGISNTTHTVTYTFRKSDSAIEYTRKGIDSKFEVLPGNNDIEITVVKQPSIIVPPTDSATLAVDKDRLRVNINDKFTSNQPNGSEFEISYTTKNTDYVVYSLSGTERKLSPNGIISLSPTDFPNGVGTYTLFLQPVSEINGSGQVEKVTIIAESKSWLPGPDITHINFPQVIKGREFAEYDINFNVTWQSINTDYINIYVGKVTDSNFIGKYPKSGKAVFNVESLLKKAGTNIDEGRDKTKFQLLFVPWNVQGDESTQGKTETADILLDKGDLKLRRGSVINDIHQVFLSEFDDDGFKPFTSPFLTHYLHVGNGNNRLVGTLGIDRDTFSETRINPETNQEEVIKEERSLVLKLYEPLPRNIDTNDTVWISKVQSIPVVDKITIVDSTTKDCTRLTPNFDLDLGDDIGYQIYDELIGSGSVTSTSVVNEFVSSSGFSLENLDLNFVTGSDYSWETFVKYSNAEERVENFYYKVKLIEAYDSVINTNNNLSTGSLSPTTLKENERTQTKINNIKKEFDAFEKFLFTSSSESGLTYPKTDNTGSLLHTTSSAVLSWFNTLKLSAQLYDNNNLNSLRNNLPQHIREDNKNSEFILFFDMVGQHFDVIYTHAKGFAQSRKLEHKLDNGIKDSLVYHMLESLGWDTKSGQQSQFLWEYAFGQSKDGTQISSMSGKERQQQIWRRVLNNLPYLYKHKGTKRALHAALSIYGVPASMLTVMEFGGPKDPTTDGTTKFSFEDRTAAINISGSASILIPWKEYNLDYPNSVEIRVQTDTRTDQQIISGSGWSLDILKDTGSLAKIQLTVGNQSSSTEPIPFFNDEYSSIFVNRISGSSNYSFELNIKEAFQERIRNEASASITSASLDWEFGDEIRIGGLSFTGSVDEIRLWKTPLSQSLLDNHTLLPDAINGNHISSSTEDLLFRNDFEYPKNRSVSGDTQIRNVALIDSYATASEAVNFEDITSYPFQYTPYDRTITADVPQSGFNVGNKIRFEDQALISNLNYKTRATRKMYDQAPLDSNRLGLFFSPIKEINMDILKSLGSFNIDNYIGDPGDEYSYEYKSLRDLRNYYFDRFTLNFQEYIQLVRYIDKSLFDVLESLVPARAKVAKGLLIEPHILERSKTDWNKPSGTRDSYQTSIDTQDNIHIISTDNLVNAYISASDTTTLSSDTPFYSSSIEAKLGEDFSGSINNYDTSIDTSENTELNGFITVNRDSDMGGISITIDTELTSSIQGQYTATQNYQQVGGFGPDNLAVAGFGLFGENGDSIRTFIDKDGNKVKDRVKVYLITEQYTELVPTTSGSDNGVPYLEEVTKFRKKVNILPFTGSDGLENQLRFTGSEDYFTHEPLDGYFPTHYRNVGDLPTGLENSYFNGSKQTASTTLDGSSPIQTFTTNPNTLRVSDTGRGSGEPILEI